MTLDCCLAKGWDLNGLVEDEIKVSEIGRAHV